jgi:hypothetical protein
MLMELYRRNKKEVFVLLAELRRHRGNECTEFLCLACLHAAYSAWRMHCMAENEFVPCFLSTINP